MIKIICDLSDDCDEKGAGGLWDLAGELAETAGLARGLETPVYGEDYGQEEIYNILRSYCDGREIAGDNVQENIELGKDVMRKYYTVKCNAIKRTDSAIGGNFKMNRGLPNEQ